MAVLATVHSTASRLLSQQTVRGPQKQAVCTSYCTCCTGLPPVYSTCYKLFIIYQIKLLLQSLRSSTVHVAVIHIISPKLFPLIVPASIGASEKTVGEMIIYKYNVTRYSYRIYFLIIAPLDGSLLYTKYNNPRNPLYPE